MIKALLLFFCLPIFLLSKPIQLGVDVFFNEGHFKKYEKKKIGLITNQTGVNGKLQSTMDLFRAKTNLVALYSPEHGIRGDFYADEKVGHSKKENGIPVYSLHGKTKRPDDEMLKDVDVLFYDIQDIGVRSYTFATTLYYVMEEAAKRKIPVVVLDRPNPINGTTVDGTLLKDSYRSFLAYINVSYCHGMTVGELARLFNGEYKIGCNLTVVPMRGWNRKMSYAETGLNWIPTSPHIPESDTPLFYATTGTIGELKLVNIGIGYTLPFKVVGAPWIDADKYSEKLNQQKLPGVHFTPFHYRPFYGSFKGTVCHGVLIQVTNHLQYQPVAVQCLLLGILKSLYPKKVEAALAKIKQVKKNPFCRAIGTEELLGILRREKYATWKLINFESAQRDQFRIKRAKYLIPQYSPS